MDIDGKEVEGTVIPLDAKPQMVINLVAEGYSDIQRIPNGTVIEYYDGEGWVEGTVLSNVSVDVKNKGEVFLDTNTQIRLKETPEVIGFLFINDEYVDIEYNAQDLQILLETMYGTGFLKNALFGDLEVETSPYSRLVLNSIWAIIDGKVINNLTPQKISFYTNDTNMDRIDLVALYLYSDGSYGILVSKGTPSENPQAPTPYPATNLGIAEVRIKANRGALTKEDIRDIRPVIEISGDINKFKVISNYLNTEEYTQGDIVAHETEIDLPNTTKQKVIQFFRAKIGVKGTPPQNATSNSAWEFLGIGNKQEAKNIHYDDISTQLGVTNVQQGIEVLAKRTERNYLYNQIAETDRKGNGNKRIYSINTASWWTGNLSSGSYGIKNYCQLPDTLKNQIEYIYDLRITLIDDWGNNGEVPIKDNKIVFSGGIGFSFIGSKFVLDDYTANILIFYYDNLTNRIYFKVKAGIQFSIYITNIYMEFTLTSDITQ